jgi:hypothetical protein
LNVWKGVRAYGDERAAERPGPYDDPAEWYMEQARKRGEEIALKLVRELEDAIRALKEKP